MSGFGRRPPPQQNVESYQQVSQRDQPQSIVKRLVRRLRNQRNIHLHAIPHYCVDSLGIHTQPVELVHAVSAVADVRMGNGIQPVTWLDAGSVPRPSRVYSLGD